MEKKRSVGVTIVGWIIIVMSIKMFLNGSPLYIGRIKEMVEWGRKLSEIGQVRDYIVFSLLHIIGVIAGVGILKLKKLAVSLYLITVGLYGGCCAYFGFEKGNKIVAAIWLFAVILSFYFFTRPKVKEQFR